MKKQVIIRLRDWMIKYIYGQKVSRNNSVKVRNHPGPITNDFIDYVRPTVRVKPNLVVIHTGANEIKHSREDQVKFVVCLSRPYLFKFFKGCLRQILPVPLLNTLSQTIFRIKDIYPSKIMKVISNIKQYDTNDYIEIALSNIIHQSDHNFEGKINETNRKLQNLC